MSKKVQEKSSTRPQHANNYIMSKHRLAEISHHFLSDGDERLPAWQNTYVIPVLLGARKDDHIVYELNRAFNRQQRCSMVLNIESHLATGNSFAALVPKKVSETISENAETSPENNSEEPALPEFCLIPVTSPSTTLALQSDRLILVVHASLGGVRIAYNQLAFLASLGTDFNVCVVMLDAKTTQDAKRYFEFLCDSAQSLLALELECGGFLLQKGADDFDCTVTTNDTTGVDGVVEGILQKFTRGVPRPIATSLSAPTGPAAYLT